MGALVLVALVLGGLVVFGVGLWFIGVNPVPPSYSPDGRISFARQSPGGNRDLFVVNPDGSHQEQVTHDIGIEGTNTWSPDGRRLLVQASVGGTSTVVRIDIGPDNKPSNAVQLTADKKADSAFPTWSPDGSMIAFQSKRDGGDWQAFVMDADGNNKRRISDGKGFASQPSWAPDGKSIVYRQGAKADPGTPKELYVAPVAGGAPRQITSLGKDLSNPLWSPDGQHILYLQNQGERSSIIFIMNADGTSPRALVTEGANRSPRFSPNGDRVAYWSITQGSDVLVVPAAGGATSNLTHLTSEDYQPTWSPDGGRLAWSSKRDSSYKIVVSDAGGVSQKVISQGAGDDYQPDWGAPVKPK